MSALIGLPLTPLCFFNRRLRDAGNSRRSLSLSLRCGIIIVFGSRIEHLHEIALGSTSSSPCMFLGCHVHPWLSSSWMPITAMLMGAVIVLSFRIVLEQWYGASSAGIRIRHGISRHKLDLLVRSGLRVCQRPDRNRRGRSNTAHSH